MEKEIKNITELEEFAALFLRNVAQSASRATIVGLSGDLGSGKTAFVKALGMALGLHDEVVSPTFVISKFYNIPPSKQFQNNEHHWSRLIHIDFYRIENQNELRALKWEDIINDPKNLVVVEWPEQIGDNFPKDVAMLRFRFIDETTRGIIG